jgi:hypothetical protein
LRLFPRDEEFFDLFDLSASRIVEAGLAYRALLDQPFCKSKERTRSVCL